jgi:DNA-binding transcriptional ArsR family regulator
VAAKKKGRSKTKKPQWEAVSYSVDQRLIKALAHELRVHILAIFNDRMASPKELSKELNEGLSQVSYHVKVLKDYDMIEMVKTEPRRGAVEHYYQASKKVFMPAWMMRLIPQSVQRSMFGDVLEDIEQDVSTSLQAGTFDKRPDWVVGRDPRNLDAKARERGDVIAARFFEEWEELEVESDARVASGESTETIPTTAVVLIFGSALGKKLKPRKKKRNK